MSTRRHKYTTSTYSAPGTLIYTGSSDIEFELTVTSYSQNIYEVKQYRSTADMVKHWNPDVNNWVHVRGLKNTAEVGILCNYFNITSLTAEDILNTESIPLVNEQDDHIVVILKSFSYKNTAEKLLDKEHIGLVLCNKALVSFQETAAPVFNIIQQEIEKSITRVRTKKNDYLLALLIDKVVDNYLQMIGDIETELEEIEADLISRGGAQAKLNERILLYQRGYLQLKRAIYPFNENFSGLLRTENSLIDPSNQGFLKDIFENLRFVVQAIDSCHETLGVLMDLYLASNDLQMNDIMKRLTVVATVFIPLTFIVGLWGMNFKFMPELEWKYGYLLSWAIILFTAGLTWWYLKRRKWF